MSEKDAGIAGKMLASAAIIAAVGFAIGAACFGISFILWKNARSNFKRTYCAQIRLYSDYLLIYSGDLVEVAWCNYGIQIVSTKNK